MKEKRAVVNYRKKGIKKSSVMSLFTSAQKKTGVATKIVTLYFRKGGGEVHLYNLERAEIIKKGKQ